jgi:hypothetical protein
MYYAYLVFLCIKMLAVHLIENDLPLSFKVLKSWSDRQERSQQDILCRQIQVCNEIALECIDYRKEKRPHSAQSIIDRLGETESIIYSLGGPDSVIDSLGGTKSVSDILGGTESVIGSLGGTSCIIDSLGGTGSMQVC